MCAVSFRDCGMLPVLCLASSDMTVHAVMLVVRIQ